MREVISSLLCTDQVSQAEIPGYVPGALPKP